MIVVNVRVDVDAALAKLRDYPTKQLPFALASALTATVKAAQTALTDELSKSFDKPTPFTMRAIGTERATKNAPQARVFIKRDQLKYLTWGIDGGTRLPAKRAIPVPVDIKLNKYGNIPRGRIQSLLARKDVFSGIVHGVGGIWQRKKNDTLVLLVSWKPQAVYKARYPFFALSQSTIKAAFPIEFAKALENARRTAK